MKVNFRAVCPGQARRRKKIPARQIDWGLEVVKEQRVILPVARLNRGKPPEWSVVLLRNKSAKRAISDRVELVNPGRMICPGSAKG